MQFDGDKEFPLSPKEVFAKLSDARFLVECIPGREALKSADERTAVCTQRPGFAFVRGTMEVTIKILETTPETSIKYSLTSKGIGSSSEVETVMTLTPKDAGTHVRWKAEVKSMGGLLKAVPSGLIRGAAQKVIADVWLEVDKRLK
ncbi:MAG TPA: SRPBCC domain-containing protein [Gemmataceae bacterium]|nr:SRPBCC domain-containing protein [Gemmataceae bacterium]